MKNKVKVGYENYSYKTLAGLIPAIFILPLVSLPIPGKFGGQKAVASYFQSVAFIEEPVRSFLYNTPVESLSSIHLYSIISSPIVKAGFTEGGRLISLLGAIVLVLVLEVLCKELMPNMYSSGIAGTIVWVVPIFVVFSFSFTPDSTTVLLTSLSALFGVMYLNRDNIVYITISSVFLSMGVFNHMWEAVVILPIVSVMVFNKKYNAAIIVSSVGVLSVLTNLYVTGLQPTDSSTMWSYSLFHDENYKLLLKAVFYLPFHELYSNHKNVQILQSFARLLMLLSILSSLYWVYNYKKNKNISLLLSTWTLSGLSIPFTLPQHFANHYYDAWVFIVPVCVTASYLISGLVEKYKIDIPKLLASTVSVGLLVIITVSPLSTHVFGVGIPGIPNDPVYPEEKAIERANDLKSMDLKEADGLLFVGEFANELSKHSAWVNTFPSHVLIYSGIIVRKRSFFDVHGYPKLSETIDSNCRVAVYVSKIRKCK